MIGVNRKGSSHGIHWGLVCSLFFLWKNGWQLRHLVEILQSTLIHFLGQDWAFTSPEYGAARSLCGRPQKALCLRRHCSTKVPRVGQGVCCINLPLACSQLHWLVHGAMTTCFLPIFNPSPTPLCSLTQSRTNPQKDFCPRPLNDPLKNWTHKPAFSRPRLKPLSYPSPLCAALPSCH